MSHTNVTTMNIHLPYYDAMCMIILQWVQQKIKKMIEEAAPTDSDDDADQSDETVEGRLHHGGGWNKALFDYNFSTHALLFHISLYGAVFLKSKCLVSGITGYFVLCNGFVIQCNKKIRLLRVEFIVPLD